MNKIEGLNLDVNEIESIRFHQAITFICIQKSAGSL